LDSNVLLRFLTRDPGDMAEQAAGLMLRAEHKEVLLVLSPLVIAEVIWVLKSFYRNTLAEITRAVGPLLSADGVEVEDREVMIEAIELMRDKNVDFVDAVLALQAARRGETVCTFDAADFKRLPVS
jgi:predicted nucleic acid-binding protein